jgi:PAS domain-containing protein
VVRGPGLRACPRRSALESRRPADHTSGVVAGRTLCYEGFARDVSARWRAETALAEARALETAIVDSTDDLIWSVDPVGFGLRTFNRALRDYFTKTRGIAGQPFGVCVYGKDITRLAELEAALAASPR